MWILQWLPDWFFYAIFLAGLLGFVATYVMRFIPFVYVYKTPIQFASVILLAVGTYMSGAISNNESWQAKVREMEAKVAEAEVQAAKENVQIVEKVVTKIQVIKERNNDIIQYVNKELVKYDETCTIPQPFIETVNRAAEEVK